MAITWQSPGAVAYSAQNGTSVSVAYPASSAAGEKLILIVGQKPSTANSGSVTTPTDWNLITSITAAGGYGAALGNDTGNTNLFVYERTVPAGGLSGSLSVTVGTNNICWAFMSRLTNTSNYIWDSIAGATGSDGIAGNVSITFDSNPGVTANDLIIAAMCIPTDVGGGTQFSAQAFTQTSVTFGTVTEINEPSSGTGQDIGGFSCRALVSSGTGSANPVMTATAGGTTTNVRGPGVFIRVREKNNLITLTGNNCNQSNTTTTGAVTQEPKVSGNNVNQPNTSTTGAIDTYAARYWVGGTGTWNATSTTNWSATSGGASGASVPTSSTNVYFDAASDTGTGFTVTLSGTIACRSWTVENHDVTITFSGSPTLSVHRDIRWIPVSTNIVASGLSGTCNLAGGSGVSQSILFNNITVGINLRFAGTTTTTYNLASNFTGNSNSAFTLVNGILNTQNYTISVDHWTTETGTSTTNLGSSTITITGSQGMVYGSGFTINAGTSTIKFTYAGGPAASITLPNYTLHNIEFPNTNFNDFQINVFGGNLTCNNFTVTNATNGRKVFSFGDLNVATGFLTLTVTGTLTITGSNHRHCSVFSTAYYLHNSPITISANAVNLNYVNFFGITGAGTAAPFTGTSLGNIGWNGGITFTSPKTTYFRGAAGTTVWDGSNVFSATSGGAGALANYPLPQDTVIVDENTLSSTITSTSNNIRPEFSTFDASSRTTALTFSRNSRITVGGQAGAIKTPAAVTWTATADSIFIHSDCDLDVVNALNTPIFMRVRKQGTPSSGTVKLLRNLTHNSNYAFTNIGGLLDLNGFTATLWSYVTGVINTNTNQERGLSINGGAMNLAYSSSFSALECSNNLGHTFTDGEYIDFVGNFPSNTITVIGGLSAGLSYAPSIRFGGTYATYVLAYDYFNNVDGSSGNGAVDIGAGNFYYGDLKLGSGLTLTASTSQANLIGAKNALIDAAGLSVPTDIVINKDVGYGVTLSSDLTISNSKSITLTQGSLSLNDFDLTTLGFSSSNSNVRAIAFGSGVITCTASTSSWTTNTSTNCTVTGQSTGKIKFTNASSSSLAGGGLSLPTIELAGAGLLTVTGANTFYNLTNSVQPASITLPASTTTTFESFSLRGTAGNLVVVKSSSTTLKATLYKASGDVDCNYLNINDNEATGISAWYAGANSIDGLDNTGWIFANKPVAITLTGNNCNQPNTTTTGAITRVLTLTGNNCNQPNTTTTGAISQTHVLAGNNCNQPNTTTTGAINRTLTLTGNNVNQPNTTTTGAVSRALTLTGNNVNQPNTSTSGAINRTLTLTGNNVNQPNTTTTGRIARVQTITGNNVNQPNTTTTGAIARVLTLTGNNCNQPNTTTTGQVTKEQMLTGNNVQQVNKSTNASITQTHYIAGNNCNQPNSTTASAINQVHELVGNNVNQANTTTTGAINRVLTLTGNHVQQANTTTSAGISQSHILSGANCQQLNTSSSGQVSLYEDLIGNNATQLNYSTADAITQTHLIYGNNCNQPNSSTTGAISKTLTLTGNNVQQSNQTNTGAISQTHLLSGNNCQQSNSTTSGAVIQTQTLVGNSVYQSNLCEQGAISQTHILTGNNVNQPNVSTSGSIGGTITLTGNNVNQPNTTTTGAINRVLTLTGNNATQANQSINGLIAQAHKLTGNAVRQPNQSSSAAIGQTGDLFGNSVTQFNRSSAGAISQHHYLTGNAAQQSNQTSAGAIEIATVLTGNSVLQLNRSETGFVEQLHILHGFNANQFNRSSNGSIVVQGRLIGANAYQTNLSSAGRIQAYRIEPSPSGPAFIRGQFTQARPVSTNRRRPIAANLNGTANQN